MAGHSSGFMLKVCQNIFVVGDVVKGQSVLWVLFYAPKPTRFQNFDVATEKIM